MKIEVYRKFYDPIEANIVANKLKANDIECFLTNEHSATLLWHLSVAHGGLNLMMDAADFPNADKILIATDHSNIEELASGEIRCPNCNANNVNFGSMSKKKINWWQIFGLFTFGGPAPILKKAYHCFKCGYNFEASDIKKE